MVGPQWPAPPPLLGFTRKRGAEEGGDRKSTRGEFETRDVLGDDVVEAVGVDVEKGNVGQEAGLHEEVLDDIGLVKVNADNDVDRGVVRCYNAEDTITISHIGANPIAEEVVGVKVHDLLLCP
ncbi:hypothetical protein B296_00022501 [Ensete ventricosum]|uniref:Uncharacterized protein n=1 Tax=Ensete ventricosum TaxID=4639 RepID=A0A426YAS7_ENSVE|nr:hypothetical protein B296_00022501 [Ensete ventricosum]